MQNIREGMKLTDICQAASTLVRLAVLFALSNLLIYLIT